MCDSCPCYPDVSSGARALRTGVGGGALGAALSSAFAAWAAAVTALARLGGAADAGYFGQFWHFVENLDAVTAAGGHLLPRLYLYSRDDHLCDYARLVRVVARRREEAASCGALVRAVEFPVPSGHVAHLLRHRDRYAAAVGGFLADVGGGGATAAVQRSVVVGGPLPRAPIAARL